MKIDKINYYCTLFSGILFFLIPVALITGPFIPDLFLVIICLNLIFLSIYEKNFEIFKNKFLFFIIFCFVASLVSIISENLSSLKSSSLYFRFGLFTIASYLIIKNNKQLLQLLFYFF